MSHARGGIVVANQKLVVLGGQQYGAQFVVQLAFPAWRCLMRPQVHGHLFQACHLARSALHLHRSETRLSSLEGGQLSVNKFAVRLRCWILKQLVVVGCSCPTWTWSTL